MQSSQLGQGHLRSLDVYLPEYVRAGVRTGSHPAQTSWEVSAPWSLFRPLPLWRAPYHPSPFCHLTCLLVSTVSKATWKFSSLT